MSVAVVLGIGVLGGVGAIARFLLDGAVSSLTGRHFPWGTLAVNLAGAFALGALAGALVSGDALRLEGTGLGWGVANVVGSLVLGIAAVWLGRELGAAL